MWVAGCAGPAATGSVSRPAASAPSALSSEAASPTVVPDVPRLSAVPVAELPTLHVQAPPGLEASRRAPALSVEPGGGRGRVVSLRAHNSCLETRVFAPSEHIELPVLAPVPKDEVRVHPAQLQAHTSGFEQLLLVRGWRLREGDEPTLTISDFWLDGQTGGSEPIAERTVKLVRWKTGPGGFALYAFRSEKTLEVIAKSERPLTMQSHDQLGSAMSPGGKCSFVRGSVALSANGASLLVATQHHPLLKEATKTSPARHDTPVLVEATVSLSRVAADRTPLLSVTRSLSRAHHSFAGAAVPSPMPARFDEDLLHDGPIPEAEAFEATEVEPAE